MGNPKAKGDDRWGYYYDMTGNESPGHCFWCGCEIRASRRYCCPEHKRLYRENYDWFYASRACIKRYWVTYRLGWKSDVYCHDCKRQGRHYGEYEVHHIIPLNGESRNIHYLNNQKNLVLLCKDCHNKRRREWNYLMKRYNECDQVVAELKQKEEGENRCYSACLSSK